MPDLERSWRRAWHGVGAAGDGSPLLAALSSAYAEPQRRYHTLQHLRECLALFESVAPLALRPAEVETALWFHDAVYDVKRHDNEARSAAWADAVLGAAGVPAEVRSRVHALVLVTRHTAVPADADQQLLVDIDLAILGASPARFDAYEAQIRAEYAHVPEPAFRARRRAILQAFLDRDRIYATAALRERLEAAARGNLARAIAAL